VQINVVLESSVAGEKLFHSHNARDAEGNLPDLVEKFGIRHGVG
jgi:hypothetical protein